MTSQDSHKKMTRMQQNKMIIMNILAFAIVFVLLGSIIFQMIKVTSYRWVDEESMRIAEDTRMIQNEIIHLNDSSTDASEHWFDNEEDYHRNPPMQTQLIIWSNDGKILNKESLGMRYYDFASMRLNKKILNRVYSRVMLDLSGNKMFFRTITRKMTVNGHVYYAQVITNVNQIQVTIKQFKKMLFICMLVFWIVSLLLSVFLAKWSMKPIIRSWEKQQKFVENASHELRTPLAIIQAKLEHLFTKPQHTIIQESENIAISLNEVRRLNQLTSDLLLLARSDGNVITLKKEPTELDTYLEKVVMPFEEVAEMNDKTLTYHNTAEQSILIDQQRIHQLLVILIDNALKYTEEGGAVEVDSYIHNRQWVIEVKDNGIGISDENKKRLFERFYRVDEARTREKGGYGLGLSIAKWIVDSHNGNIQVLDNEPKGTIFKVSLPLSSK